MYTNISGLTTSLDIHTLCMLAETAREIDIHSLLFSYILVLGRCGTKKVKALLKTLNTTQKKPFHYLRIAVEASRLNCVTQSCLSKVIEQKNA